MLTSLPCQLPSAELHESAGAVVSRTVTMKPAWPVLFCASVAVHCTIVLPSGNVLPEAGEQVTATDPLRSVAIGDGQLTTAPAGLVASTVMADVVCEYQVSARLPPLKTTSREWALS